MFSRKTFHLEYSRSARILKVNRGKSSLAESPLLTNFGRFFLSPTRRLITREEKENSITIDSFNQISPHLGGKENDERQVRIWKIRVGDEKVRKTMKMENKRSHDGPSLKQLT